MSDPVKFYRLNDTVCEERHVREVHDGGAGNWTPVVVIDPEDREAVERLAAAYDSLDAGFAELMDEPWTMPAMRMRQALREFANPKPPKPDEPTGLGAVVEDDEGRRWVRLMRPDERARWYDAGPAGGFPVQWQQVAAVRVLSEGVTA